MRAPRVDRLGYAPRCLLDCRSEWDGKQCQEQFTIALVVPLGPTAPRRSKWAVYKQRLKRCELVRFRWQGSALPGTATCEQNLPRSLKGVHLTCGEARHPLQ